MVSDTFMRLYDVKIRKMFLFLVISLLVLEFNDSKELSRTKRKGNPETFMNCSEILQYHGYPNEEHEILTNDGYFLTINRILGRKALEKTASQPVVLLMPGLLTACGIWLANMLALMFGWQITEEADGVKDTSTFHIKKKNSGISAKTGQKQLSYVGYSQGSTIGFMAFSAMPALAEKIKLLCIWSNIFGFMAFSAMPALAEKIKNFFVFGPIYLVNHIEPWYKMIIEMNQVVIKAALGRKEICVLPNRITRILTTRFCDMDLWRKTCANILLSGGGMSENNVNMSRLDVIVSHLLGCTSTKVLLHWKQMHETGQFKRFDYGSKNMEKYNQMTPPFYDIRSMNIPIFMWGGEKDQISTQKDTRLLLPLLSNLISYKIIPQWMHYDYLFGLDA
ncbi:hypothetical protein E2320_008394, partial [Naja naja]